MYEGRLIKTIRNAVRKEIITEPFSPRTVRESLGIEIASTFLPKHRVGNPGGNSELFVQVCESPALYRLKQKDD